MGVSQAFELLPGKPPKDHLCLSILAFLLCFPIGIIALIFSIQTRHCNKWNDRVLAQETSYQTFYIAITGIILGSFFLLILLIFILADLLLR